MRLCWKCWEFANITESDTDWPSRAQAEVEELEDKLKSLESICSPIISKMYQGACLASGSGVKACVGLTGRRPRRQACQASGQLACWPASFVLLSVHFPS